MVEQFQEELNWINKQREFDLRMIKLEMKQERLTAQLNKNNPQEVTK